MTITYAEFDYAECDVRVVFHHGVLECVGCAMGENVCFRSTDGMIKHLFIHQGAGDNVPQGVFEALLNDQASHDHQMTEEL